jgi:SAM-dependent methyltransferase
MVIQVSNDPGAFHSFEQKGWNEASDDYEQALGPLTAQSAAAILDAAGVTADCTVLDVCTGHGVLAYAASQRGAKVCALDFAENMVAAARRNAPAADCRQGDAQNLPYADSSFDAVVCGYGIIHLPQPDRALAEMRRVLRPDGRVAISVWQPPSSSNGFGLLLGAVKAHGRLDVPLPHGPDLFQFSSEDAFRAALIETGFGDINVISVPQTYRLKSASEFLNAFTQGTVRNKALFLAQDEAARSAIAAALVSGMNSLFRGAEGFEVPMPALVGSGIKR